MYDDELLETMYKLIENLTSGNITTEDNSIIFLQYNDTLTKIDLIELKKMLRNTQESNEIIQMYENRKSDEYILVAYHNARFMGMKRKQ